METCPCGSAASYAECCEPVITGARPAETPEKLMRARYSAHVKAAVDFIHDSLHPDSRSDYSAEATKAWAEESEWVGLEIVGAEGGAEDTTGKVEFIARFREKGVLRVHHEVASFSREKDGWYFVEGKLVKPMPLLASKIGRNDPCACGSGVKYKKCCGK